MNEYWSSRIHKLSGFLFFPQDFDLAMDSLEIALRGIRQ
ncbi:Uncharacterised protein [Vibrio cholerae]|nr:Uncharacterised protein [Vibrio cholerae]CSE07416.1 Uncharacterised protein [Vibrio cholerae]